MSGKEGGQVFSEKPTRSLFPKTKLVPV